MFDCHKACDITTTLICMARSGSPPDCTGQSKPSSLQNIFKELHDDLGCPIPKTGSLVKVWASFHSLRQQQQQIPSHSRAWCVATQLASDPLLAFEVGSCSQWAEQGVLLLNTVLTVRAHQANSHAKKVRNHYHSCYCLTGNDHGCAFVTLHHAEPVIVTSFCHCSPWHWSRSAGWQPNAAPAPITVSQGWEAFTDAAIAALSKRRSHVVFLLWGKPAQTKEKLINQVHYPYCALCIL